MKVIKETNYSKLDRINFNKELKKKKINKIILHKLKNILKSKTFMERNYVFCIVKDIEIKLIHIIQINFIKLKINYTDHYYGEILKLN